MLKEHQPDHDRYIRSFLGILPGFPSCVVLAPNTSSGTPDEYCQMICEHGFAWSEVEDAGSFSVKGAEISQACHSYRILFGESRPKPTLYIDCEGRVVVSFM